MEYRAPEPRLGPRLAARYSVPWPSGRRGCADPRSSSRPGAWRRNAIVQRGRDQIPYDKAVCLEMDALWRRFDMWAKMAMHQTGKIDDPSVAAGREQALLPDQSAYGLYRLFSKISNCTPPPL